MEKTNEKQVTIATHNGSKVCHEHNVRNEKVVSKEEHIDPNGKYEIWKDEPIREAYHRLFDKSVEEYNDKQTREDRKIKDYYTQIKKDAKKHLAYEMIIGIYGDNEVGGPVCSEELGKQIMKEFVDNWQERNPNLELIGAYYHADERGKPHVHLDYIPIAHGYQKGMETQTGLVKALGEQGLEKKGKLTAQMQWEKRENEYFEKLCRDKGLDVVHPVEEHRKHLETNLYKAQKSLEKTLDDTKDLLNIQDDLNSKICDLKKQWDYVEKKRQKALEYTAKKTRKITKGKEKYCVMSKEDYDKMREVVNNRKKDVEQMAKTDLDIQVKSEEINQLMLQVQADTERILEEARLERNKAKKYKEKAIEYIEAEAEKRAEKKFTEFKQKFTERKLDKDVEKFMEEMTLANGSSVLNAYKQYKQLVDMEVERMWSRSR